MLFVAVCGEEKGPDWKTYEKGLDDDADTKNSLLPCFSKPRWLPPPHTHAPDKRLFFAPNLSSPPSTTLPDCQSLVIC